MVVPIVQNGDNVLRKISKEVPISDITKPEIQNILKNMEEALDGQDDGVALAAPQIGISLRIFIISGRIFEDDFMRGVRPLSKRAHPNLIFINPIIKKMSKDKKLMDEGCLSVRPIYGRVRRATKVTVEAYNEKGKKFTKSGSGLVAHIFQHEIDHLEGILFIDKAKDTREEKLLEQQYEQKS